MNINGLKIQTFQTPQGTVTRYSYLKDNEYEVYAQCLHPVTAIDIATRSERRKKDMRTNEH
jgi:hypothetical protein